MAEMIHASKVAAAALHQVKQATQIAATPEGYVPESSASKMRVHLQVAQELLALIAPQPFMVNVQRDGTMTPILPEGDPLEPADDDVRAQGAV